MERQQALRPRTLESILLPPHSPVLKLELKRCLQDSWLRASGFARNNKIERTATEHHKILLDHQKLVST